MAEMKISNTLKNDTEGGILAYAQQLKDTSIDWSAYSRLSSLFKTDANKFQHKLNDFMLKFHDEYKEFLSSQDIDGVIDTWEEVKAFLAGIPSDQQITLDALIKASLLSQINVRMSDEIPGMLEVATATANISPQTSINRETGALTIVFNFEPTSSSSNDESDESESE